MDVPHVLIAGVLSGVIVNVTGYLITGKLFHPYQSRTPATWRPSESWIQYVYSMLLRLLVCLGISSLYAITVAIPAQQPWIHAGTGSLLFGICIWVIAIAPVLIEASLFVNWHIGFVCGILVDWLVVCILASVVSAWLGGLAF